MAGTGITPRHTDEVFDHCKGLVTKEHDKAPKNISGADTASGGKKQGAATRQEGDRRTGPPPRAIHQLAQRRLVLSQTPRKAPSPLRVTRTHQHGNRRACPFTANYKKICIIMARLYDHCIALISSSWNRKHRQGPGAPSQTLTSRYSQHCCSFHFLEAFP